MTHANLRNPKRCPTHPGVLLREDVLPALGLTQGQFALRLGVSRLTVAQLLHAKRAVTPETALRLEKFLGSSAESWLRMQTAFDLWHARQHSERFAHLQTWSAAA